MISCAFLWWFIWYYVDVKYNDTSCYVIRSNLLCSFCFLLPFSFFLILSLSLCLSVRLTSSFVSARRLLLFFFSLSAEEEVENFDVSSLQEEVLRNIEADSFWCMSKLLDGIQVNWFPVRRIPGLLKPTVCVCVWTLGQRVALLGEKTACVFCVRVCVCLSHLLTVAALHESQAWRCSVSFSPFFSGLSPGMKLMMNILSLHRGQKQPAYPKGPAVHQSPWERGPPFPALSLFSLCM